MGSDRMFHGMETLEDYEFIDQLGQGTFGVVTKAKSKRSGNLVAMKKLIVHDTKDGFPITAFREVTIMKNLRHGNVLQLLAMVHQDGDVAKKIPGTFYTITPYASTDLTGLLNNPRIHLKPSHVKCILLQLFEGIEYIHSMRFLHRDIKAANILIDVHGSLKIADFGLARIYYGTTPTKTAPGSGNHEYTGLVSTRWYRAPELILGDRRYTTAIDMWSCGCIFGEMLTGKPIMEGESDVHQGTLIFQMVGPANETSMPGYESLPGAKTYGTLPKVRHLEDVFHKLGKLGLDLLSGLLTLNPQKRLTATGAKEHAYFQYEPMPCRPCDLPTSEDSHEADLKKYKEEKKLSESLDHSNYGVSHGNNGHGGRNGYRQTSNYPQGGFELTRPPPQSAPIYGTVLTASSNVEPPKKNSNRIASSSLSNNSRYPKFTESEPKRSRLSGATSPTKRQFPRQPASHTAPTVPQPQPPIQQPKLKSVPPVPSMPARPLSNFQRERSREPAMLPPSLPPNPTKTGSLYGESSKLGDLASLITGSKREGNGNGAPTKKPRL